MTVFIYALSDPETGEVRYVGKTMNMQARHKGHRNEKSETHKCHWIAALKRKGLNPIIEELERIENSSEREWHQAERFWISYLRFLGCRLCNILKGGHGPTMASRETALKISLAKKGKPGKSLGPHSEQWKANIRAGHARRRALGLKNKPMPQDAITRGAAKRRGRKRAKPFSMETLDKMRQAKLGKSFAKRGPRSPETRLKLSVANLGKTHLAETKLKQSNAWWSKSEEERNAISEKRKASIKRAWENSTPERIAQASERMRDMRRNQKMKKEFSVIS